ncbi:DUF7537 family lipoprotein [Haloarcula onubensis]|uniref:Uncharacterized protein n=1 Tax=Haloarcula onubensis TaxID=2950539 RepID=A0ABU2FNS7_9EURY|nr:hypothetical protein [Halomicroarcula sp. S3CR25-11]MDS0282064.1 hypothetical protein [Halomicroarcula sp. S3CR25-11]
MRKATVVVVAVVILLAGCSGGGGGAASPTEESGTDASASGTPTDGGSMDTPMEPTSTPTADGDETDTGSGPGEPTPQSAAANSNPLDNATVTEATVYNGSQQTDVLIRNETAGAELVEYTRPSTGTASLYTTDDYVAYRNGTTGNVEYGGPDSYVGTGVSISAEFTVIRALLYVDLVEWEETGTTTVDGESALVFESDSLNQTALNEDPNFETGSQQSAVQSVDGRMVIGTDGRVHSVNVQIETPDGTIGSDVSFGYDDITVDTPGWVDESQAP